MDLEGGLDTSDLQRHLWHAVGTILLLVFVFELGLFSRDYFHVDGFPGVCKKLIHYWREVLDEVTSENTG